MTATNRIDEALAVCRATLPLMDWATRSPGKGQERYVTGNAPGLCVSVWYNPYTEWHLSVHLTPQRIGQTSYPFAAVHTGGPDLSLALRTVAQSVAAWARGVAAAMEVT